MSSSTHKPSVKEGAMSKMRYLALALVIVILISGCSVNGDELKQTNIISVTNCENVIIVSDYTMEYLEQDPEKWFLNDENFDWDNPDPSITDWDNLNMELDNLPWDAEQWMQGNWNQVSLIDRNEIQVVLGQGNWTDLYNHKADWIYYLEHPYTWNELEFPENKRTLLKGVNQNIIDSSWLPSIYRQFFTLKKASSGTLTIWVIGSVDVYMDPPFGTRLLSNQGEKPRCFVGRGVGDKNKPTKITISIPEIKSGTHCLYFVHRAAPQAEEFCMLHTLAIRPFASQTTRGGWTVDECDCSCLSSNETAEYLVHDVNITNNAGNTVPWEPIENHGVDYVLGKWAPVSVIPHHSADMMAWGKDYRGTPWHTLYNKCANWVYTTSDPMDGWNHCRAWETNIYRQVFSVDKDTNANLIVYTNDLVDVYVDPFIDLLNPIDSTPLINDPPPNSNPYHVGSSVNMKGGRLLTIPLFLTKGTHTLYFVHKNQDFPASSTKAYDYYGLIYSLCCKEECVCDDE